MRIFYRVVLKICPAFALLFSVVVTITTMYINEGISPPLIFVSVQVYLNWYCIYSISKNATTMKSTDGRENSVAILIREENNSNQHSSDRFKYWYCDKCRVYTYRPTQHCGPCNKCFHFRDHHCFVLGCCILRQNMGNFILVCLYTSLACLYSLTTIGPYLYANLDNDDGALATIFNFCFPVAVVKFFMAKEDINVSLVTLFDILFSACCICFVFGSWKLYLCLTGKQRYYPHVARKQDIKEIFGSYGLSNVIFPYNGFLGTRDIDGSYVLKEV